MSGHPNGKIVGYVPETLPSWVQERAILLKWHLSELGVWRMDADEYGYNMDEAILLLASELLLPEMPLQVVRLIPDHELVLVHCDVRMGPKPATSESRLVRALGVARPDGILSVQYGLPWILTTFKGAGVAAGMGYITIPIANLKRLIGPPPT